MSSRPDLSADFAATPRRAVQSLPPRQAAPVPPAPPSLSPAPVTLVPAPVAVAPASTRATRTRSRSSKVRATRSGLLRLPVYVPEPVLDELGQRARHPRTHADELFDSFEQVGSDRLVDHFTPKAVLSPTGVPRRPDVPRPRRGIQRQFLVTAEQLAWVDSQVDAVGAPSRSALCAAVLTLAYGLAGTSEPGSDLAPGS